MLKLNLNNKVVSFIGDPHLGKKFPNIRLDRQGEREYQQINTFFQQLSEPADICIMVGDLFDTYNVTNEVLLACHDMIEMASKENPDKSFIMMNGNHDVARDSAVRTSFEVLKIMCCEYKNVRFITKTELVDLKGLTFLVCPYQEFSSAHTEVSCFLDPVDFAVGHWDTEAIAGPHNLVPTEHLSTITNVVVTGHVHSGENQKIGNVTLYKTGSMLPYSHSEDPNESIYVTRTVAQLKQELATDPKIYEDKCVRILISSEDEEVPYNFTCLQVTTKKVEKKTDEKIEVVSEHFNFENLFTDCFKENGLDEETIKKYWEIYSRISGGSDAN